MDQLINIVCFLLFVFALLMLTIVVLDQDDYDD